MVDQNFRTIAVLVTCHNRKSKTMACLERLSGQVLPPECVVKTYLVDDGSTDGTSEAVRESYPEVTILAGDGSLFWCNGMRLAWRHASEIDPDYYFWINDDAILREGALLCFLQAALASSKQECIVIGSCCDPKTGAHTYGGKVLLGKHPGKLGDILPDPIAVGLCDTFNGNCVLVTRAAFRKLGIMRSFKHSTGDTDYGLRARRLRIPQKVLPGYVAECSNNPLEETWRNKNLPRRVRYRMLIGRKGLPPGDWWRFLWTHAGIRALIYWPTPYLRVLLGR